MARSADEIRAEDEALKAQGKHHFSSERKALAKELKALEAISDADGGQAEGVSEAITADFDMGADDPYDSDEWRFIAAACAEFVLPKGGSTTGLVKTIFNEIDAKVKAWRLARKIIAKIGIGEPWPQFAVMNLNPGTGEPIPGKVSWFTGEVVPEKHPQPEPVPVRREIPTETEAQMPVDPGMPAMPGFDSTDSLKAAVAATIGAEIGASPEPAEATT